MNAQGKQYGRKNLGMLLQRSRTLGSSAIADAIRDDLEQFAGHSLPHDDRTVLVMKRTKA
jgi:serine phosphatase RsbU (regulator of sigma subunit)